MEHQPNHPMSPKHEAELRRQLDAIPSQTEVQHGHRGDHELVRARLLGDAVLVRLDPPRTMRGNLHVPDREFEWTAIATVLAIGNGLRDPDTGVRAPIEGVAVGDRVVFAYRPSHEVDATTRIWGPRTMLIKASELGAIITDDIGHTGGVLQSKALP